MADIKAALAHARLVKTAGNAGNTGNTESNPSDIKPFGAIELAAINQEQLATPATQAGGGLLPMLALAKSGNVEVATEKTLVKQQLSEPVTTVASVAANFSAVPQFSKIIKATPKEAMINWLETAGRSPGGATKQECNGNEVHGRGMGKRQWPRCGICT
jgi:hypothetical protein